MLDLRQASLRNVWIIAHREYTERIRTRGFLITTLMIPMVIGGFVVGSSFLASRATGILRIGVVSSDPRLARDIAAEVSRQQDEPGHADAAPTRMGSPNQPPAQVRLAIVGIGIEPGADFRPRLDQKLKTGELDGYLASIPALPGSRPAFTFTPRSRGMAEARNLLTTALEKALMRDQLGSRGLNARETESILEPVTLQSLETPGDRNAQSAAVCVSVLFFVMYLVIMLYGMNVARSIIEEKTSRIFEVMLATIRPEALMAGKILGVGSVGLTQVGIWLAMLLLLAASSVAIHVGGSALHVALTGPQIAFFFLYFVLGYLLYSSIAAALGAITNSEQELQQMNMILVLPLLSCFVLLGSMMTTPDSTLARVLALVPLFTPLLMYFRVSLGHPQTWEVVLSLVITSGSICGIVWVTSRIYRVGVLMYGKRPNFAEIRRWVRYS